VILTKLTEVVVFLRITAFHIASQPAKASLQDIALTFTIGTMRVVGQ